MIFRGPFPDVAVPDVSLTEFVLREAAQRSSKPALIEGPTGRIITYGELQRSIREVAAGLAARGFKKGDVFGILSPNVPEYGIAFHAVATLGGVNCTVNPLYTAPEIAHQLKDAGAKYLVTVPQCVDKAAEAATKANIEEMFIFEQAGADLNGATAFSELFLKNGTPPEVAINPKEDLVVLPYSSGTTGLPKGVMLTHHNLVANICQTATASPMLVDDVLIGILPFFHIYGMVVTLGYGLASGTTIVTLPRFDLEQFLQTIQDRRVTVAHLVPPIVLALARHPLVDRYDLSALRWITSGAAPLSEDLARACAERLGCNIKQGYGLTETSPVTHLTPDDRVK